MRTGEARVDFAVLCAGVGDGGEAIGGIESGLVFDSKSGALRDEPRCP
jgi:hypothetical protein